MILTMANKKLRYQIDGCYDKEGKAKSLPADVRLGQYFIYFMMIGRGAKLINENNNTTWHTSEVQEIFFWENGIKITTLNTVYYLKPYLAGEDDEVSEKLF